MYSACLISETLFTASTAHSFVPLSALCNRIVHHTIQLLICSYGCCHYNKNFSIQPFKYVLVMGVQWSVL